MQNRLASEPGKLDSSTTIILGFTAVVALLAAVVVIGISDMAAIQSHIEQVVDEEIAHIDLATQMRNAARERSMLLHSMTVTRDPFERDRQHMAVRDCGTRFLKARNALLKTHLHRDELALLREQEAETAATVPSQYKVIDLVDRDRLNEATRLLVEEAVPTQDRVVETIDRFLKLQQDYIKAARMGAADGFRHGYITMSALGIAAMLLGVFVAAFVRRRIAAAVCALRRAGAQLRRANGELEMRVQERTAELEQTNDRLRQEVAGHEEAKRHLEDNRLHLEEKSGHLERVNAELQQFVHVISHDLKAPVRAVSVLCSAVEEDAGAHLSHGTRRQLELLRRRAARMDNLLNALVEYAQADCGCDRAEVVDTGALVSAVFGTICPPPTFTVTVEAEMPVLRDDRSQLWHVFSHLILNAIKHHDRGAGHILVRGRDLGEHCEFAVVDDGPGIAPDYQGKVFEIFETLSLRDETEYTGLGLALVKKIVAARGGRVWLESELGQGASFHFTWPKAPVRLLLAEACTA